MSGNESTDARRHELQLSVVIPAYNEELAIEKEIAGLHEVLRATGLSYEVIVVDDGSKDRTAEIAARCECRLLRNGRNRGYGASLKRGIAAAHAERILITDADGTYPPSSIPALLAQADAYDMVVGARTGANVHHSLVRAPAKLVLRKLASFLAGQNIPDLNSGMRVLRRSHVQMFSRILPAGFSFTTTITLALLCTDRTVGYVSVDYGKRTGSSKIRPTHAYHFLILILRVIVLFNPLKVFLPLGAFSFLVGVAKFVYDVHLDNLSETAVMGLLGGVIVWSVGLLADQNARLNLERWDTAEPSTE